MGCVSPPEGVGGSGHPSSRGVLAPEAPGLYWAWAGAELTVKPVLSSYLLCFCFPFYWSIVDVHNIKCYKCAI